MRRRESDGVLVAKLVLQLQQHVAQIVKYIYKTKRAQVNSE